MALNKHLVIPAILACAALSVQPAWATNGYFTHGIGVKNKALAGAGTAMPTEAIGTASNPAAAIVVGEAFEAGFAIFSPRRSFKASQSQVNGNFGAFTLGAGQTNSDSEYFPIPYISKVWPRGDNTAFAVNFYGRGGMNTDYKGGTATLDPDGPGPAPVTTLPGTFGAGTTGVNLSQAFIDLTYAMKTGNWNLGFSTVLAMQIFKAKGLLNFAGFTKTFAESGGTVFPENLTNNSTDISFGYGFKFGAIYEATDKLNLGIAYQTRTWMQEFDDYSDLFAESGGFDIPASGRLSASYRITPSASIHFDYEYTWYSKVDSVANDIGNIFACPTAGAGGTDLESCLGGKRGAGFKWDDVGVYKFGIEWAYSAETTFRAGYSFAEQPIAKDQILFNILAPAVVEEHITFGFTRKLANEREFSASLMIAPSRAVSGTNTFDPTQQLTIKMNQFELEFGYSF